MMKYGLIQDGKLVLVPKGTPGAKPIHYDPIPAFDQLTQAVFETPPVDEGDFISVGNEVREVVQDEAEEEML